MCSVQDFCCKYKQMYTMCFEIGRDFEIWFTLSWTWMIQWLCSDVPFSSIFFPYTNYGASLHFAFCSKWIFMAFDGDQGAVQLRAVFSDLAPAPWGLPNSGTCASRRGGCLMEIRGMGLCHITAYVKWNLNELVLSMKCHVMLCHIMKWWNDVTNESYDELFYQG